MRLDQKTYQYIMQLAGQNKLNYYRINNKFIVISPVIAKHLNAYLHYKLKLNYDQITFEQLTVLPMINSAYFIDHMFCVKLDRVQLNKMRYILKQTQLKEDILNLADQIEPIMGQLNKRNRKYVLNELNMILHTKKPNNKHIICQIELINGKTIWLRLAPRLERAMQHDSADLNTLLGLYIVVPNSSYLFGHALMRVGKIIKAKKAPFNKKMLCTRNQFVTHSHLTQSRYECYTFLRHDYDAISKYLIKRDLRHWQNSLKAQNQNAS